MKYKRKFKWSMVLFPLILCGTFWIIFEMDSNRSNNIENWVHDNNDEVKSINYKILNGGPYYIFKGQAVYKVNTEKTVY
jgi:hypothetical protein